MRENTVVVIYVEVCHKRDNMELRYPCKKKILEKTSNRKDTWPW